MKSNAKRREIEFSLTIEQYNSLPKECYYCGTKEDIGVDRLNSDLGYTQENCVPCCPKCNYTKREILTPEEMLEAIKSLKHYNETGILPEKLNFPLYKSCTLRDRSGSRFWKLVESKKRNINLEIDEKVYMEFILGKTCYYCTAELPTNGHGLDRTDNTKGYLLDNILPCCPVCNSIRSNQYTVEETLALINGIQMARLRFSIS